MTALIVVIVKRVLLAHDAPPKIQNKGHATFYVSLRNMTHMKARPQEFFRGQADENPAADTSEKESY